ncbi:MAG: hypothetical protein PUI41_02365 [Lachnospiraceae bacterium]|nr:hypothetical protein [Lachnospiraceae bacterium]MDD7049754.1 hypothetical protein [Lachnospiraceae bacterium]MDY4096709.1 DUF6608 family protein [Lachnospiraceae bacterium]
MRIMLKKTLGIFCVVFTAATLVSSSLQLAMGILEDSNMHIMDRAVLTLIGAFILVLVTQMKVKNKWCQFLFPYIIFMALVMFYVWLSGFWSELHPNAYRDVFLNDTIAYIVVVAVVEIIHRTKNKN